MFRGGPFYATLPNVHSADRHEDPKHMTRAPARPPLTTFLPDDTAPVAPSSETTKPTRRLWGTLSPVTSQPGELSSRELSALNNGLERAWHRGQPLPWILARVRCEFLKLTPHQYSAEHGAPLSTLMGLEGGSASASPRYDHEIFTRLLRGWDDIAQRRGDPVLKRRLSEATDRVLSELTKSQNSDTYRVYHKWRIVVGPDAFKDLTKLDYKNLWARAKMLLIPEFHEALEVGRTLGFISKSASGEKLLRKRWVEELKEGWLSDCLKRGRPEQLSQLHVTLAASNIPLTLDALGPHSPVKLSGRTVVLLAHHQPVPWKHVEPLFSHLVATGVLNQTQADASREAWLADDLCAGSRATDELREMAKANGIENRLLADALETSRHSTNKPVLPVFRALSYNESTSLAPIGVLAHLIVSDDTQLERILEKRRGEIAEAKRRAGSELQSPITIERLLWNVDYQQLPFDKREVQLLEWRRKDLAREAEIVLHVQRVGEERAARALQMLRRITDETTLSGVLSHLIYRHGAAPLESLLGTSVRVIHAAAAGNEVPTLPRVKHFLHQAGRPFTTQLELDWRLRSAEHQALFTHSDLLRFINSHIAEAGESRGAVIEANGAVPALLAPLFHSFSATGYLEPAAARTIAKATGIRDGSPVHHSFSLLLSKGTIAAAMHTSLLDLDSDGRLRTALQELLAPPASESVTADSLPALRRAARGDVAPMANLDLALPFLRAFPGATLSDISRALSGNFLTAEREIFREFTAALATSDLPLRSLPAVVADNLPIQRKRPDSVLEAIRADTPSPYFPIGVAAYLSAANETDAIARVDRAKAAILAELQALRVPVSELAVQVRLWGVRPDDIKFRDTSLFAAIWSRDRAETPRALSLVSAVGEGKMRSSLQRGIGRLQASTSSEIFSWAVDSVRGAEIELCTTVGLAFGSPKRLIDGSMVPYLHQLRGAARIAGIRVGPEAQVRWALSLADELARAGYSPACRLLLAQAAIANTESGIEARRRWEAPMGAILARAGLEPRSFFRELKKLQKRAAPSPEHTKGFLAALGYTQSSPFTKLLAAACSNPTMAEGICAWGTCLKKEDPMLSALDQLNRVFAAQRPALKGPNTPLRELLAVQHALVTGPATVSKAAATAGLLLAGATAAEISAGLTMLLQERADDALACEERNAELAEERARLAAERVRTEAQVIPAVLWSPTERERALPFEHKLEILAQRLQRDIRVTNQELLALFEQERPGLAPLQSAFGAELPWFIGALHAFRYPDAALKAVREQLRAGLLPKHPGKVHFNTHMAWLNERGSLGKLNETSVRLAFGDRFIAPEPYKPRRRDA